MARERTKASEVIEGTEVTAEGQEMPSWATPDIETQQVAVYTSPAKSQFRRKLTGPELLQWVASQVVSYDGDEEAMGLDIFGQIAGMGSADAILSGKVETTKGKEILGVPLVCDLIKFVVSTEQQGCPYFAVMEVRRSDNNERLVVTKGGWRLVAQLGALHYLSTELLEHSPYLVAEGTPGALAIETYPHYFKLMENTTNSGNQMSYIIGLMQ
jgi:hypothetical protein